MEKPKAPIEKLEYTITAIYITARTGVGEPHRVGGDLGEVAAALFRVQGDRQVDARRARLSKHSIVDGVKTGMKIDEQRIDEVVLALLHLGLHDGCRAWKGFDWDSLNRLHEQGMIEDPLNKAKSIILTDRGLSEAKRLFEAMFVRK